MADNTTLNAGTGGDVVASDDISGVKHQRVKIEYGADGSATDVSSAAPLPVQISDTDVALGSVTGRAVVNAMGERESMAVVVTGEDVWRGNELTPEPTSTTTIPTPADVGEQMTVVSEDANDTSAGTGVRTVEIHYIDASGDEQEETVTLNGTTGVNTVATNIRFVNDFYTLTVGSNGVAEGHIKIYKTGSVGLVYNMIAEGGNKSLVPHRMVPAGKTLVLTGWHCTEAQDKRVVYRIRSTDMHGSLIAGVFCFKDVAYVRKTATGWMPLNISVPALSIVKISAWSDQASAEGSCSWSGELVDD
ncbi:MAG: hypothetical protein GY799_13110 [Desulfobulbaceae bacterium]|nr:hypothetical protein [Desulfobulbaceae bacterium]